jgi:hypothetical protein
MMGSFFSNGRMLLSSKAEQTWVSSRGSSKGAEDASVVAIVPF